MQDCERMARKKKSRFLVEQKGFKWGSLIAFNNIPMADGGNQMECWSFDLQYALNFHRPARSCACVCMCEMEHKKGQFDSYPLGGKSSLFKKL